MKAERRPEAALEESRGGDDGASVDARAVEYEAATRFEFERLVRRMIVPATVKHVALTLSTYADSDGSNAFPGVRKLAATCQLDQRTVRRSLTHLREDLGVIVRVMKGSSYGRRKVTDVYQLAIPNDFLDRVELLPPDELPEEAPGTTPADPAKNTGLRAL